MVSHKRDYCSLKSYLNSLNVRTGGRPSNRSVMAMFLMESSSCRYDAGTSWSISRRYSGIRPTLAPRPATALPWQKINIILLCKVKCNMEEQENK